MKMFAVLNENNIVVNVIIADSLEIAQSVTGLVCVESTAENAAMIGNLYNNGNFEKITPPTDEIIQGELP